MLAAGLKGVEERLDPPASVERNIYALSEKEREKYNIHHLPESLGHALSFLEESKLMKESLGDHIFNNFLHVKRTEWEKYRTQVTPWEIDKYLQIL
jgi:glutamine synthetase